MYETYVIDAIKSVGPLVSGFVFGASCYFFTSGFLPFALPRGSPKSFQRSRGSICSCDFEWEVSAPVSAAKGLGEKTSRRRTCQVKPKVKSAGVDWSAGEA